MWGSYFRSFNNILPQSLFSTVTITNFKMKIRTKATNGECNAGRVLMAHLLIFVRRCVGLYVTQRQPLTWAAMSWTSLCSRVFIFVAQQYSSLICISVYSLLRLWPWGRGPTTWHIACNTLTKLRYAHQVRCGVKTHTTGRNARITPFGWPVWCRRHWVLGGHVERIYRFLIFLPSTAIRALL